MTSTIRESFPTRITTLFNNKKGQIALDQLRSIESSHIIQKLGSIDENTQDDILKIISIMFQR